MALPQTGKNAPNFSLQNQNEETVSLKDFNGKWLVLYFYPKDDTPGCTVEAIEFTTFLDGFHKLNAEVVGVSPDSVKSHCGFIEKQNLQITLLSDTEKRCLSDYGVWQEKRSRGFD